MIHVASRGQACTWSVSFSLWRRGWIHVGTFTWWIIWPQQEKTNNAPERGCDMASKTKPGSSVYNTKFICNELVLHEGFKPCCAKLLHFQVLYWPFSVWAWSYEDLCSHFFNLDRIKKETGIENQLQTVPSLNLQAHQFLLLKLAAKFTAMQPFAHMKVFLHRDNKAVQDSSPSTQKTDQD